MKHTSLYVPDLEAFYRLKNEVRTLWYKKYGEALSIGKVVMCSLVITRNFLQGKKLIDLGDDTDDNKR